MSTMGVYKLHKLARKDNKSFDVNSKLNMERDLHVVENAYAEHINSYSAYNGLQYEKDENATKVYLSGKPFKKVKEYSEFEEVSDEKPEDTQEDKIQGNVFNLSTMKKDELITFAKEHDFKINVLDKKEDIVESIKQQSQNKE